MIYVTQTKRWPIWPGYVDRLDPVSTLLHVILFNNAARKAKMFIAGNGSHSRTYRTLLWHHSCFICKSTVLTRYPQEKHILEHQRTLYESSSYMSDDAVYMLRKSNETVSATTWWILFTIIYYNIVINKRLVPS